MIRRINYIISAMNVVQIDICVHDDYKIPDSSINKALIIAMNYLMENMKTEEEEPE